MPPVGIPRELRDLGVIHGDGAGLGEPEIASLGPHGVQHRGQIPCLAVVGHLLVQPVRFGQRMIRHIAVVLFDARGGVLDGPANLKTADHHGGWPVREQRFRGWQVDEDVVFLVPPLGGEHPRHHDQLATLLRDQFATGQRRVLVGGTLEQAGQVGRKADHHNNHAAILRLCKSLPQHLDRVAGVGPRLQLPGVDPPQGILPLAGNANVGTLFGSLALLHHPDRNARASVEGVDEIAVRPGERIVFADGDRQQAAFPPGFKGMNHPQREGVVDVIAHVGVEDERDRPAGGQSGRRFAGECRSLRFVIELPVRRDQVGDRPRAVVDVEFEPVPLHAGLGDPQSSGQLAPMVSPRQFGGLQGGNQLVGEAPLGLFKGPPHFGDDRTPGQGVALRGIEAACHAPPIPTLRGGSLRVDVHRPPLAVDECQLTQVPPGIPLENLCERLFGCQPGGHQVEGLGPPWRVMKMLCADRPDTGSHIGHHLAHGGILAGHRRPDDARLRIDRDDRKGGGLVCERVEFVDVCCGIRPVRVSPSSGTRCRAGAAARRRHTGCRIGARSRAPPNDRPGHQAEHQRNHHGQQQQGSSTHGAGSHEAVAGAFNRKDSGIKQWHAGCNCVFANNCATGRPHVDASPGVTRAGGRPWSETNLT